jgi:hypothetical protein
MSRGYAVEGIADVRMTDTASRNLDYYFIRARLQRWEFLQF